jgi:hypothetical protein
LIGEETNSSRDGHRFEFGANRRDFTGSEITRHFRNLCAENRSLRSVWHIQATFLDASRLKSLAANFRFQGCCLLLVRRAGKDAAVLIESCGVAHRISFTVTRCARRRSSVTLALNPIYTVSRVRMSSFWSAGLSIDPPEKPPSS